MTVTTEPLDLESVPDFRGPVNWDRMRRLNEEKWKGIRFRVTEVESAVEQAMYVDLLLEIVNLAATAPPLPVEAVTVAPVAAAGGLELALIKALAGKTLDCEHGSTLLSTVATIMDEMK
jgi:hypothetical protein